MDDLRLHENIYLDFGLSYLLVLVIVWLRYGVFSGAAHALVWGLRGDRGDGVAIGGERTGWLTAVRLAAVDPARQTMWREARSSLVATCIYALPGTIMAISYREGGTAMYRGWPDTAAGWLWLPASAFVLLALQDAYFYWSHRAMHHPRLYQRVHHTHHRARQPTAFASFSFSPWESAIIAWFLPALCFVLPVHVGVFAFVLTLSTLLAATNHSGWEILPLRWLERGVGAQLITARHHNLHHTRFKRNYGLYFRWWDRWFGTDSMEGDPAERSVPASGGAVLPERAVAKAEA